MTGQAKILGYWLVAAGASLFSTKAIFIKLAYREDTNASLMLAYRMAFALPFFVAVGIWAWRSKMANGESPPGIRTMALAMATGFVGYYLSALLDFSGLQFISAQLERLLLYTYPLFVMLLGAMFFQHKIKSAGVVSAAITYLGLAIIFGMDLPAGGRATIIGTALVLGAAITFAYYQLVAKNFITLLGSALFTAVSLSSSAVLCIVHHAVVSGGNFAASPRFLWLTAACSIVATVIPSFLINAGMARTSPQATAMISTISPLVTIVMAISILGEPFTLADAIGSALVLAGVGYFTWADARRLRLVEAAE